MAERPGGGFEVEKPGEPGADIVARTRQLYDYYSQLLVLIRGLGGPENMSLQARAGAVRERVEGKGGEKFELINDLWQKATLTNEEKEKLVSFGDELDRENEALEGIYKEMRGDEGALGRIRPTAPSPSPEPPPAAGPPAPGPEPIASEETAPKPGEQAEGEPPPAPQDESGWSWGTDTPPPPTEPPSEPPVGPPSEEGLPVPPEPAPEDEYEKDEPPTIDLGDVEPPIDLGGLEEEGEKPPASAEPPGGGGPSEPPAEPAVPEPPLGPPLAPPAEPPAGGPPPVELPSEPPSEPPPGSPPEPPEEPPAGPAPAPAPPAPEAGAEPETPTVPPEEAAPAAPPEAAAVPAPPEPAPAWAEPLDPARLEMMARQEIARIERDTKSTLSAEEKDIIRMLIERRTGVGAGLAAIDQQTAHLYEVTYGGISRSSKLKRFLTGLGTVVGAGVLGAGLRTVLRVAAPGFHFAGSLVGGVLGGTIGALRGYFAEKGRQFGLGAITNEFHQLAGTDRKRAVAFLHEVLTTQSFRGNHKELLNILALYRTEVTNLALAEQQNQPDRVEAMMRFGQAQIAVDEMTAQTLLTEGLMAPDLLRLYREDPTRRSARIKAALKGALRGAAIGAGVGLISDLVSMYLSHARAEDAAQKAYDQFMQRGAGRVDYINRDVVPLPAEAQLPSEFASQDWLGVHGFNVIPTDYGNALKHAIYANGIRPEGMNISEEQYQGFLQLLNYVKPEQFQNINVPLGEGAYHFDTQILQNWVTHVFQDPQGIDFQHIAHADSFIGQVTEGVAQKFAGAAAAAAAPEVFGEMAAHGVAVGAGAGLAGLPGPRKTEEATVSGVSAAPRAETGEQRQARVRDEAMEDYHQILSGREKEIEQQLLPLYEEARERVKEKGNYVFELDEIKRVLNEAEGKPEDERHDHLAHVIWIKKGRKENDLTKEADSRHADELLEIMARIREKRAQIEAELDRQANEIKAKLAPENPDDVIWLKTDLPSGDLRAKMRKLSELTSSGRWKIIWTQEAVDETPELSGDFYLTAVHPDVGDEGKLFYSQDSEAVYSPDQTSIGGRMLSKIKELKKME